MEYIVLALTMPLLALMGLLVLFRWHREPVRAAARGLKGREAAPVTLPPPASPSAELLRDLLPYPFLLLVVVGIVVFFSQTEGSFDFLQLALLSRFSLLTGVLLVGLVPLGIVVLPGLLGGLFVLRTPWQLFNITWLALLVAATVLVTIRVIEHNVHARYGLDEFRRFPVEWSLVQWVTLLLLALPVPVTCLIASLGGPSPAPAGRWAVWISIGLLLGVGMGLFLLAGAAALEEVIIADSAQLPGLFPFGRELQNWHLPRWEGLDQVGDALAWLVHQVDPDGHGIVRKVKPASEGEAPHYRFTPGHLQALVGMTIVLVFYLGSYVVVTATGMVPNKNFTFTSLFYLLLLLMLLGLLVPGLAFWLDRYHVPVTLTLVLFSFLLYWLNQTDHFFSLKPPRKKPAAAAPRAPAAPPTLEEAVAAWRLPAASRAVGAARTAPKDKKTLVVITASGGGIQASAWTTRVLVELHQLYGDAFTRSIGLISAVSGGSVGVMYYLDRWQDDSAKPVFSPEAVAFEPNGRPGEKSICERAMASSLEAAAWGLVFPDLLRALFPPALVFSRTDDRGARIEDAWRTRLEAPDARLPDWSGRIRTGAMPVPVFNAAVVETGQRFLSSPIVAFPRGGMPADPVAARELLDLYPDADIRVSTAVRLSATFPFISPICRPLRGECAGEAAYHFGDGGYIDNEGMVTVIDWLSHVLAPDRFALEARAAAFDQVLLVRLMPFPRQAAPKEAAQNKGWFYTALGPIDGLLNVRIASQAERNDLAVRIFTEMAARRNVPVVSAIFTYELESGASPPLSWSLTDAQKEDIGIAWRRVLGGGLDPDPLAVIDGLFDRV